MLDIELRISAKVNKKAASKVLYFCHKLYVQYPYGVSRSGAKSQK